MFSHRFHTQKLWCFQGGALVSARLCRLPEQEVHQHNKIYILPQNSEHILAGIFSHRFHRFTQNFLLRKLPQISQNTQNFLAEKNSVKSVDSVGSIRALTSVRICEICGSFFNCKLRVKSVGSIRTLTSVRVKSVGVFQLQTLEKRVLPQAGNNVTAAR